MTLPNQRVPINRNKGKRHHARPRLHDRGMPADETRAGLPSLLHRIGRLVSELGASPAMCKHPRLPDPHLLSSRQLLHGTRIGTHECTGTPEPVCIPANIRARGTHIISSAGTGKTTLMLNMFLQDIQAGHGAMFLDIHGDAVKDALSIIPPELYNRSIYLNPGDPEWIPLWNPLACKPGNGVYRRADEILACLRSVFSDWSDRLEHVLRNGLIGLGHIPGSTLLDLYSLLRQGSRESEALRRQILQADVDEPVRRFWEEDFLRDFRKGDLHPPRHVLSRLVSAGTPSLMLSQPENRIDLRRIMDEGQILLVDLSALGSDLAEILGRLLMAILLSTAYEQIDTPEKERKRFCVYADEAHRVVPADTIEEFVIQGRAACMNLCIAHQCLAQFGTTHLDALSTVGSTILGRLDKRDSQYFAKDMCDRVDPKDIMRLEPCELIARIGTNVVRCTTLQPPRPAPGGNPERLVEESRHKYCSPAEEIRARRRTQILDGRSPSHPSFADGRESSARPS